MLVVGDQLIIGETSLVQSGSLFLQLRLRAVPARLLLSDTRAPLGDLRPLHSRLGLLPMLAGGSPAPAIQLLFARSNPPALVHARHRDHEGDHRQNNHDYDGNKQTSRHDITSAFGEGQLFHRSRQPA